MINVNNEIVVFKDNEIELNVNLSTEENTVWLNANQMALLFDKDEKTIRKHINNVFLTSLFLLVIVLNRSAA